MPELGHIQIEDDILFSALTHGNIDKVVTFVAAFKVDNQQYNHLSQYLPTLEGSCRFLPVPDGNQQAAVKHSTPAAVAPAPKGVPHTNFNFDPKAWEQHTGRGNGHKVLMPKNAALIPIANIDKVLDQLNLVGRNKTTKALQQGPSKKYWLIELEDGHSEHILCWIFPKQAKKFEIGAVLPKIKEDDMVAIFNVSPHAKGISIGTDSKVFVAKDKKHTCDILVAANA